MLPLVGSSRSTSFTTAPDNPLPRSIAAAVAQQAYRCFSPAPAIARTDRVSAAIHPGPGSPSRDHRAGRIRTAGLVVLAAALLTGCGREPRHQVRVSVEQLASIAAEGSLMAYDLAHGQTKTTFVRVHGNDLSAQAQHEAEKLNDDPVAADLRTRIQVAIKLAADIGGAIDELRTSPQDRAQAAQDETKLRGWAGQAGKLAESI
jgi:hypothetical protein